MKKIIFSILTTCVLVWLLLSNIDLEKAVSMFKSFPAIKIVWLLFIYAVYLELTSMRAYILLKPSTVKLKRLFTITLLHNMYNRILPFRTGEVTFVLLLRKDGDVGGAQALASLVVARIFDYLTISLFFIIAVILIRPSGTLQTIAWVMGGLMTVGCGILLSITFGGHKILKWLEALTEKVGGKPGQILKKAEKKIREVVESLQNIGNKSTYILTSISTVAIWLTMFYLHYTIISGLGNSTLTYLQTIIGSTFGVMTNILPIHGFAGFGTLEAGWTAGYMLIGMSKQTAISSSFFMHIVILFSALVYGIFGLAVNSAKQLKN